MDDNNILDDAKQGVENLSKATNAATRLAKIAKNSGGTATGAAAAAAKEMIKDPQLALKAFLIILVTVLTPILMISCCLLAFGMAFVNFANEALDYIVENNQSYGNIDFDRTVGVLIAGASAVGDLFKSLGEEIASWFRSGTYAEVDGERVDLGDQMDDEDFRNEMLFQHKQDAAAKVVRKRLDMIKRSLETRIRQYQAAGLSPFALSAAIEQQKAYIADQCKLRIPYMLHTSINYNVPTVTDYDAAAILCAYSAQKNTDVAHTRSYDLRNWIGRYSGVQNFFLGWTTAFGAAEIMETARDPATVSEISVRLSNGSDLYLPLTEQAVVPSWKGTFMPQYRVEEMQADQKADENLESDPTNEEVLASGQGTATRVIDENGEIHVTGFKGDQNGHGLIDDMVYLESIHADLSENVTLGEEEGSGLTIYEITINVDIRLRDPEELVTNVIGLWQGPLDQYDEETKHNRPYSSDLEPDLLAHEWTDSRGVTYTRQNPFQYEHWKDSLECLISEYDLGYGSAEDVGDFSYSDGGMKMVDEANRIYDLYHINQTLARTYVFSEFYGRPSNSTAAWCCAFVYVCGMHCGYVGSGKPLGTVTGSCTASWKKFADTQQHRETTYRPKPGDLIYYTDNGTVIEHIGIVESYDPESDKVHTIEGNSLSKHTYSAAPGSWVYGSRTIYGYASPAYPESRFAETVSIYKQAAYTTGDDYYYNMYGTTVFGPYAASSGEIRTTLDRYVKTENSGIYAELYDASMMLSTLKTAWVQARKDHGKEFDDLMYDGFFEVYGKPYYSQLNHDTGINFFNDRVLREFSWCVFVREHGARAAAEIRELGLSPDDTIESIIDLYYTTQIEKTRTSGLSDDIKAIKVICLRKERRLLEALIQQLNEGG